MNVRRCGLSLIGLVVMSAAAPLSLAPAGLMDYVQKPDASFSWTLLENHDTDIGKIYSIDLTSQTWHDIVWKHQLTIYEPAKLAHSDAVLLFVTGGSTDRKAKPEDHAFGFALAKLCGARVAVLPQVPNQPLLGGRKEDDLITETFVRYLDTQDESWPLLFPMAKSAVKAMDAIQQFGKLHGNPVTRFVVTGASKRGWTTWLSGIVDDRVIAIAPMVIPTLNFRKQIPHQKEYFGEFSEQIEDYVRRGLLKDFDNPERSKLWTMVDPFSYRDRLTKKPILMINGTNDRYWTLDSLNLYWDDLPGSKQVVYLPNAGHGLDQNRDYATNGIGAFFRHAVTGRPLPQLSWKHGDGEGGKLVLDIQAEPAPKQVALQVATSESNDFRESTWSPVAGVAGNQMKLSVTRPPNGQIALFGDMTFEIDGLDYHLSTTIRQVGVELKPAKAAE